MKTIFRFLLLVFLVSTNMNPLLAQLVQTAVICVDDDNSSAKNGSSQNPYNNIQMAITNAADFDTIKVAAGNYNWINNMGKSLVILGGYTGGTSASYSSGSGGNFSIRTFDATMTVISGGTDTIGVNLTRFTFNPFNFVVDNFTVKNSKKGIVFDVAVSWPHVENVTISNNIIENNGQPGVTTLGGGILVNGNKHRLLNNIIRNNHGGRGAGISGNRPGDTLLIQDNIIENNTCYDDHGGGIYLGGFATITRNIISGNRLQNTYGWGGGVLILGTAYMSFNVIKDNYCPSYGGAVFVDEGGIAYMDNELIYRNSTSLNGAGVALDDGAPGSSYVYITNSTVSNNYSPDVMGGNAIFVDFKSFCTIKNCIMAGNGDDFFVNSGSGSTLAVTYTLSGEGITGMGNFMADPLFADTANGDFRLKSKGGRYNPASKNFVNDSVHSPAIDAGDPTSVYNNEPAPNGNRINLGCYGNTMYASKSYSVTDIQNITTDLPTHFSLDQNYPNPFNPATTISFSLPSQSFVSLKVFDALGREVAGLISEEFPAGSYLQQWTAAGLPSGVYFYRLQAGLFTETKKLVLLR